MEALEEAFNYRNGPFQSALNILKDGTAYGQFEWEILN